MESEGGRYCKLGCVLGSISSFALNRNFELICTCLVWNFASERNVKFCSVHQFCFVSNEVRIMGGEYGLLITFWKWRLKVIGNAIELCVVNICAFGLIRIFELICPCFLWNFASTRNVKSCSVHLKKRRPIFSLFLMKIESCVDIWLLIGF